MENQLPSGYEVESASLHVPVDPTSSSSGLKGRLVSFGSTCKTKVHSMKSSVSDRVSTVKSSVSDRVSTLRSGMESDMRSNPAKWAGIAAGAGFALGLGGRLLRSRMTSRRMMPELIIIEGAC